jgi:hypothetical protein
MRSFDVSLNRKNLCLAGVGERGVLSAIISWVAGDRGEDLFIQVGGLANEEHIDWVKQSPCKSEMKFASRSSSRGQPTNLSGDGGLIQQKR